MQCESTIWTSHREKVRRPSLSDLSTSVGAGSIDNPASMSKLILSADDFGYSQDTVERTIACIDDELLTSASIMANMPATVAAASFATTLPDFSFGIHICFCDGDFERPLCSHSEIPSLTLEDGRFFPTRLMIKRALVGQLRVPDIERELQAQLARLRDLGVQLSYVDGHGNLHKYSPFVEAMRNVLPRFGIGKVRRTQNIYLKRGLFNPNYWFGAYWNRAIELSFRTTDGLYLPASTDDDQWPEKLRLRLKRCSGVVELAVHPGSTDRWRRREEENLRTFKEYATEEGIDFVGWKDIS